MILSLCTTSLSAQVNGTFIDNLKTIQVKVNGKWGEPPVIHLKGSNFVEISFDDLQHDYVRYTYRITHCNADWTPSDLYEGDYMTGMNGSERIDDYEQSMNTEMMYNHYSFRLPNEDVSLLISGNYKVDILEDGDDEPVATACFSILEPIVSIEASVTPNTDIDTYQQHQQVEMNINYQHLTLSDPMTELIPVVLQNHRWDNRPLEIRPSYMRNNQLIYTHNRALIFEAGNEFRRFEILDKYVPTMRIEHMEYREPFYHAEIMQDEQRRNYKYDQDQNGRYLIRNTDNVDNETESDYFFTHFQLKMPELPGGNLYINGDFTYGKYDDEFMMEYDLMDHAYKITLPLKQGSYNYQYLFVPEGEDIGTTIPTEGSFFQTENEYYIYVYQRPFGGRYDKLVGFKQIKYTAK